MKIRVLGEDISKARIQVDGGGSLSENCPIAQVLRRMFVGYYSGVGTFTWGILVPAARPGAQGYSGGICGSGVKLIREFDSREPVDPCEVELYGLENVCSPSPTVVEDAPFTMDQETRVLSLTS